MFLVNEHFGVVVIGTEVRGLPSYSGGKSPKLRAEATTRALKEQLEDVIVRHEQIAEEIERASEPDGDAVSSLDETSVPSSETPGR